MANIKSAKKRAKTNEKRRQRSVARRSDIKTATKKVLTALEEQNVEQAKKHFRIVESKVARAKGKKLFKPNTASRKISRLAKKIASVDNVSPSAS